MPDLRMASATLAGAPSVSGDPRRSSGDLRTALFGGVNLRSENPSLFWHSSALRQPRRSCVNLRRPSPELHQHLSSLRRSQPTLIGLSISIFNSLAANLDWPLHLFGPSISYGSVLESGSFPATFDEAMILKNKAEDLEPYLNGRCIFLVGMMGSGKTTVGRILSDALSYSFFDSDALIEQAVGGTSVAEIFKRYGEGLFRDNETEVLRKLSTMHRLVVSTGGGAVIRPINWKYMQKGISVWLDVPLEALARRIADVGTESRPLLHQEPGDAYAKAFKRLSSLWEERSEAYANASARVSLENIAAKLGTSDVCNVTPTVIAIEALQQIESFLKK